MPKSSNPVFMQNTPLFRQISSSHIATGLAVLLFDVVFYWSAFRPLEVREQEAVTTIATLEEHLSQRSKTVAQLRSVVERAATARSTGDKLIDKITIGRQVAFSTLVAELDVAANKAGIEGRDRTYDIEPIEDSEELRIVRINTNFQGRYENVVRFLNLIDRSEKFLIIESLGASPLATSGSLQVTMRIDTFVRDL